MRVASVCSSVGGLDLGLHRAGHTTVSFCELDPWRRTILARHFPGVPIHTDMKALTADDIPECDLFVGGTPCQDLSVAGKRAGLDGERSGLFHKFAQLRLDLYERHGCAWSLWENVAGALSSNEGRDFATVLASHVGADVPVPAGGWGGSGLAIGPWGTASWRLLDAQYFGVPQRRRRVFVVGHLGATSPVEVLADTARRGWHSPASGEARPDTPTGPDGSPRESRVFSIHPDAIGRDGISKTAGADADGRVRRRDAGLGIQEGLSYTLTTGSPPAVAGTGRGTGSVGVSSFSLRGRGGDGAQVEMDPPGVVSSIRAAAGGSSRPYVAHTLTANGFDASEDGTGRGTPIVASALDTMKGGVDDNERQARHIVAFSENQRGELIESDIARSVTGGGGKPGQGYPAARVGSGVRRLTPTECERLMAWPDGWTLPEGLSLADAPQTWPGGPAPLDPQPDGRRYSACGDGVVAHVAEWIGLGFPVAA